jgi:hypothetical protein
MPSRTACTPRKYAITIIARGEAGSRATDGLKELRRRLG